MLLTTFGCDAWIGPRCTESTLRFIDPDLLGGAGAIIEGGQPHIKAITET